MRKVVSSITICCFLVGILFVSPPVMAVDSKNIKEVVVVDGWGGSPFIKSAAGITLNTMMTAHTVDTYI